MMENEEQESRILKSMSTIGPLIAPLVVGLTGMMFLAGWLERQVVLQHFGISEAMFAEPFQVTLARGYLPLLAGLAVAATLVAIVVGVAFLENLFWRKIVIPRLPDQAPSRLLVKALKTVSPINRLTGILMCLAIGLTFSAVSGTIAGEYRISRTISTIEDGCIVDCFTYEFGGQSLTGIIVAQDATRTALHTADDLKLVETSKVTGVRPFMPIIRTRSP